MSASNTSRKRKGVPLQNDPDNPCPFQKSECRRKLFYFYEASIINQAGLKLLQFGGIHKKEQEERVIVNQIQRDTVDVWDNINLLSLAGVASRVFSANDGLDDFKTGNFDNAVHGIFGVGNLKDQALAAPFTHREDPHRFVIGKWSDGCFEVLQKSPLLQHKFYRDDTVSLNSIHGVSITPCWNGILYRNIPLYRFGGVADRNTTVQRNEINDEVMGASWNHGLFDVFNYCRTAISQCTQMIAAPSHRNDIQGENQQILVQNPVHEQHPVELLAFTPCHFSKMIDNVSSMNDHIRSVTFAYTGHAFYRYCKVRQQQGLAPLNIHLGDIFVSMISDIKENWGVGQTLARISPENSLMVLHS